MKVLIARVIAIEGKCPAYRLGDKIVIEDGFRLRLCLISRNAELEERWR